VTLLEAIKTRGPLVGDGGIGTELQKAGLEPGASCEPWNVERPKHVLAMHRAYVEAGAQLLTTNTFGASRFLLAHYGLESRVAELCRAGARLARQVYTALLHLYPSEFRGDYADELILLFVDMYRAAAAQGMRAVVRLWQEVLLDLVSSAIRERMRTMLNPKWAAVISLILLIPTAPVAFRRACRTSGYTFRGPPR